MDVVFTVSQRVWWNIFWIPQTDILVTSYIPCLSQRALHRSFNCLDKVMKVNNFLNYKQNFSILSPKWFPRISVSDTYMYRLKRTSLLYNKHMCCCLGFKEYRTLDPEVLGSSPGRGGISGRVSFLWCFKNNGKEFNMQSSDVIES